MSEWQPIETAPKHAKRLLLYFPIYKGFAVFGRWDDDKYAKTPRPYWTHDMVRGYGVHETRKHQPTHWMPEPEPPK